MKCLNCNNELTENMQICPVCGISVDNTNNINESSVINANPEVEIEIPIMNNEISKVHNQEMENIQIINNEQSIDQMETINIPNVITESVNNTEQGTSNNILNTNTIADINNSTPLEQLNNDNVVTNNMSTISDDINIELNSTINVNENNSIQNLNMTQQPTIEPNVVNNNIVEQPTIEPNVFNNIEQPVIETVATNDSYTSKTNNQKKSKAIIPIVLIAIIVIASIGGFLLLKPTPKKIYSTIIDKSFDSLLKVMNNDMYTSNTVTTEFSIKPILKTIDQEYKEVFDLISSIDINGKYQIDYVNKSIVLNLDSKYNNKDMLKGNAYIANEKMYLNIDEMNDRYITEDLEGFNEVFETLKYQKDIKIIIEELKNAINKSLKDEYFKSEKVKMNVNGKQSSVNKITLLLNYDNTMDLTRGILTNLKSNNKFLDSYVNLMKSGSALNNAIITEVTKEDIIREIDKMIKKTEEEPISKEGDIIINLYTKGLKADFVGAEAVIQSNNKEAKISLINDKKNIYTLTIKSPEEEFTLPIKEENDTYTFEYNQGSNMLTGSANFKTNDYKLEITTSGVSVKINYKETNDFIMTTAKVNAFGTEIGLEATTTIKFNESITLPTFNNTVKFEDITEEEQLNILSKLMEKEGLKQLIEITTINNTSSYDDYEYNYNDDINYNLNNSMFEY